MSRKGSIFKISKLLDLIKAPKKVYLLVLGIALGLSILVLFWPGGGEENINKSGWQAVFLDNNQVYFGKLTLSSDFYILSNVFYLQTESGEGEDELSDIASDAVDVEDKKTNAKLVKLGNELHNPEDEMFIEKSKILFWENLKATSTIVRSIEAYYQQDF